MTNATLDTPGTTDAEIDKIIDLTSPVHKDRPLVVLTEKELKQLSRHLRKQERKQRKNREEAILEAQATTNPAAIYQIDPADVETPCDKRGRTLGEYTITTVEQLERFFQARAKAHGHRTAPLKKRGDVAKRRRIAASHAQDIVVRTAQGDLIDQIDELHEPDDSSPISHAYTIPAQPKFMAHAC